MADGGQGPATRRWPGNALMAGAQGAVGQVREYLLDDGMVAVLRLGLDRLER
jgi:hypothetical protein